MSALFGHRKGAFTGAAADRPGLLRAADKGVLFLDEIGELGLDEQAMILRAIEEKTFLPVGADKEVASDFQLIAGTNRDLGEAVAAGRFRDDLFARLNLWTFALPALRDRREDIEPNLDYELDRFAEREGSRVSFNSEARRGLSSLSPPRPSRLDRQFPRPRRQRHPHGDLRAGRPDRPRHRRGGDRAAEAAMVRRQPAPEERLRSKRSAAPTGWPRSTRSTGSSWPRWCGSAGAADRCRKRAGPVQRLAHAPRIGQRCRPAAQISAAVRAGLGAGLKLIDRFIARGAAARPTGGGSARIRAGGGACRPAPRRRAGRG